MPESTYAAGLIEPAASDYGSDTDSTLNTVNVRLSLFEGV